MQKYCPGCGAKMDKGGNFMSKETPLCHTPDGITIKPDGVHELSPHRFREKEILRNVTVQILECEHCGEISIGWYKQEDTYEEVITQ